MYGIGGWEPALASEVDKLGYGDCKGLTNYTKALLTSQGIESYYTVVYGGDKVDIDPEFTKMQGNHVILNIPRENESDIWLECTSQESPFNYMGDFTDDRYALRLKTDGGEIVKTTKYTEKDNLEKINCVLKLDENGGFKATFQRHSYGVSYSGIFRIQNRTNKDQKAYYRNEWGKLQNIQFENISFEDDKRKIEFLEKLEFSGTNLATKAGSRLLVPLNFIQQENFSIAKNLNRQRPLRVKRGRTYKDEFIFQIPKGFEIEALPESRTLTSEFGNFSIKIEAANNEGSGEIKVNRSLVIKEGLWSENKYKDFKFFVNHINHLNSLKAVIVSTSKT